MKIFVTEIFKAKNIVLFTNAETNFICLLCAFWADWILWYGMRFNLHFLVVFYQVTVLNGCRSVLSSKRCVIVIPIFFRLSEWTRIDGDDDRKTRKMDITSFFKDEQAILFSSLEQISWAHFDKRPLMLR